MECNGGKMPQKGLAAMTDITTTDLDLAQTAALEAQLPAQVRLDECDLVRFGDLDCVAQADARQDIDDDAIVAILPGWTADDGNAEVEYDHAASGRDAAEEYVSDGDWGDDASTTSWISVDAWRVGYTVDTAGRCAELCLDRDSHTVEIEASEPACADGCEHCWRSPHEVVGGIEENPGVHGHGGGVVITEVCQHCGTYRVTDTWAQNPVNGEQGLTSVEYREADDESLAWVEEQRDAND